MPLQDIYHGIHLRRLFPKNEMSEIYLAVATRALAFSMINLFIPLYLYMELGFTLKQIAVFYIIYSIAFGAVTPFAAKLAARVGLKHAILMSCPLYIMFYFLLYSLKAISIPFLIIPIFLGVASGLFWISFHIEFAKVSVAGKRGVETGKWIGYSSLAVLFGPLIGGILIDTTGFTVVFVIASILLVASATFLFFTKERHVPAVISFRHVFSKRNMKNSLAFIGYGVHTMAGGVLWPLFIFFILHTYTSLGFLGSLAGASTAFVTFIVGKMSDKYNKRHVLKVGSSLYSISWFIRHFVETVGQVFGVTMFASMVFTMVQVPSHALVYEEFQENLAEKFVFREMALCVGRILVLLVFLFTGNFLFSFMLSGIGAFAFWLF
ncbi:MAG: MFS transporter [Nanoarchaeota archaeon]|nr:MFS transporter [Nanoarchaeota archaeon]